MLLWRWVGFTVAAAVLLGLASVITRGLSEDGRGNLPTWDPSFRVMGGGLGTSNRHDVAICINTIDLPPEAAESLRRKVLAAVPYLQGLEAWSAHDYYPEGPVRVDIGCPPSATFPGGPIGAVTKPSEYVLFINLVPSDRATDPNLPLHNGEDLCSGDSCSSITSSTVVTDSDSEGAIAIKLSKALGLYWY